MRALLALVLGARLFYINTLQLLNLKITLKAADFVERPIGASIQPGGRRFHKILQTIQGRAAGIADTVTWKKLRRQYSLGTLYYSNSAAIVDYWYSRYKI